MDSEQTKEFIKKQRLAGFDDVNIKYTLLSSGVSEESAEECFHMLGENTYVKPEPITESANSSTTDSVNYTDYTLRIMTRKTKIALLVCFAIVVYGFALDGSGPSLATLFFGVGMVFYAIYYVFLKMRLKFGTKITKMTPGEFKEEKTRRNKDFTKKWIRFSFLLTLVGIIQMFTTDDITVNIFIILVGFTSFLGGIIWRYRNPAYAN